MNKKQANLDWTAYGLHHAPGYDCPLGVDGTWQARALNAEAELNELRERVTP